MPKDIPNIEFNTKKSNNFGIEILTIESLANRRVLIKDYNSEKVYQIAFNTIMYYKEDESNQLAEFV